MIRAEETLPVTTYYPRARRKSSRRSTSHFIVWQALAIILLVGGFLPAGLLVGVGLVYETRQLIMPGVISAGLDLGNLSKMQAMNELNQVWNVNHSIQLSGEGQTWTVSPVEIGLFLDPSATTQAAYQASRQNLWTRLEQIVRQSPSAVPAVIGFRPDLARATLEKIVPDLATSTREASLHFENGTWQVTPGSPGYSLDVDATLAQIEKNPSAVFFSDQVLLVMKKVEPQESDFSATIARLQAFIDRPLNIQVYDPIQDQTLNWSVSAQALASWLVVDDPQSTQPKIQLDPAHLAAYLAKKDTTLAPVRKLAAYTAPTDLTQFWQAGKTLQLFTQNLPTTYSVEAGDSLWHIAAKVEVQYWMILQANPGVTDNNLRVGQILQIPSKSDMLPLPVVLGKRIVVSINQQHMWTYENGTLRKEYVISTGIADSPTMPGVYQVRSHIENAYAANWDLYMPYFMGIYEAVPGFMNGIHGLPIMSNGRRLWANVLGTPITYGCVLMDLQASQDLYQWAQEGVIVEIDP